MKTRFQRAAAAVLLLSCAYSASALDFKGVEIGAQTTPDEVEQKLGVECGLGSKGMQVCNGQVTIAREPAHANVVISSGGRVQRIRLSIASGAFDVVAPQLIQKFGKPTSDEHSVLHNGFGASFEQIRYTWAGKGDAVVTYLRFSSDLTRSSLYFSTSEDRALMESIVGDRAADL